MSSDLIQKRLVERSLRLAEVRQKAALKTAADAALKTYGHGSVDAAKTALEKILEIDPDQPDALHLKALIALDHKDYASAEPLFARAIAHKPNFPLAYYNQGNAFRETNQHEKAAASYHKAIEFEPNFPNAYGNLGLTYLLLSDDSKAAEYLQKAVALKPDHAQALNNLGNIYRRKDRLTEAAALYNRAIINEPGFALGYNNLGNALRDLGQMDQAIEAFKKAQAAEPMLPEAHYNLGLAYLLMGDFQSGWDGYQWRHKIPGGPPAADHIQQPRWDGTSDEGKSLYLYPEQVLGDIIQFSRYVPIAASRVKRVILRTPPSLQEIFRNLDGIDTLCLETEAEPNDFDLHASLMDLPRLLNTNLTTILGKCPYLSVDKSHVKKWAQILGPKSDFRIGLIWAGQPLHDNDRNRSLDPELLKPLTKIKGISLYSLQVGRTDKAVFDSGASMHDLVPHIETWSDTAAAMKNLDLVISVDTSCAHMAGALGCDVWTLLPFLPDWRWQLTRTDSPWYPTMRLFRQSEIGNWAAVIEQVSIALDERLS